MHEFNWTFVPDDIKWDTKIKSKCTDLFPPGKFTCILKWDPLGCSAMGFNEQM